MNEIKIFENPEFGSIRTIIVNGKIYFAGVDVARALGYSNTRDAISRHCKGVVKHDGVIKTTNQYGKTTEQVVEMAYITEGDIYRLVVRSQLPLAEKFETWVFDEVLPSIRQVGGYSLREQRRDSYAIDDPVKRAERWIEEQKEKQLLESKVQELTPKAHVYDKLIDSRLLVNFRDAAKEIGVSQSQFTGWLKDEKYIYATQSGELRPMEAYMESGLFQMKPYQNPYNGYCGVRTYLTPTGLATFKLMLDTSDMHRGNMPKHGGRKRRF